MPADAPTFCSVLLVRRFGRPFLDLAARRELPLEGAWLGLFLELVTSILARHDGCVIAEEGSAHGVTAAAFRAEVAVELDRFPASVWTRESVEGLAAWSGRILAGHVGARVVNAADRPASPLPIASLDVDRWLEAYEEGRFGTHVLDEG